MDAERERGTVAGDVIEELIEVVCTPAHHMQHRAKYFVFKFARAIERDDGRRDIGAAGRPIRTKTEAHGAARVHVGDPAVELVLGLQIDHRPNLSCWIA